ncbi:MAG: MBL fold metallo-hydrolase [Bdellovibrionales bacterium]|nr:MBL fold metallo-hydrolase [Bdellovibrionales bacterium]
MKIIPVDCKYVESGFAASYLLIREGRALFIECNTNHAIPHLLKAAEAEGISPDQVDGLIITHVHLDHAGGAGLFLRSFPGAILYAHPKAARHAIDPARLVASATKVYGEAFMRERYGEVLPCDESRVRVLQDGDSVFFQGVEIEIKHTRGHANHHLVAFETLTRTLFTGDSCGVSYPEVNARHGIVALASTSPTDFDGEAALEVIDWIERLSPERIAPTHFGFIEKSDHHRMFQMLRDEIRFSKDLVERIRSSGLTATQVYAILSEWTVRYFFERWGIRLDAQDLHLLEIDLEVNAQGLCFAASPQ